MCAGDEAAPSSVGRLWRDRRIPRRTRTRGAATFRTVETGGGRAKTALLTFPTGAGARVGGPGAAGGGACVPRVVPFPSMMRGACTVRRRCEPEGVVAPARLRTDPGWAFAPADGAGMEAAPENSPRAPIAGKSGGISSCSRSACGVRATRIPTGAHTPSRSGGFRQGGIVFAPVRPEVGSHAAGGDEPQGARAARAAGMPARAIRRHPGHARGHGMGAVVVVTRRPRLVAWNGNREAGGSGDPRPARPLGFSRRSDEVGTDGGRRR